VAVGDDTTHVWQHGGGEIKAPATGQLYVESTKHEEYGFPDYYFDQIQGQMDMTDKPWEDIVVFTPKRTHVTRFSRNQTYWNNTLFPALKHFYFNVFIPTLRLRLAGLLKPGEVVVAARPLPPLPTLSAEGIVGAIGRRTSKAKRLRDDGETLNEDAEEEEQREDGDGDGNEDER
jgi:hypothetical protein